MHADKEGSQLLGGRSQKPTYVILSSSRARKLTLFVGPIRNSEGIKGEINLPTRVGLNLKKLMYKELKIQI